MPEHQLIRMKHAGLLHESVSVNADRSLQDPYPKLSSVEEQKCSIKEQFTWSDIIKYLSFGTRD